MNVDVRNSLVYLDYEGNPITEPEEGQIATCENLEGAFRYTNGQWEKISVNMKMTAYDINKQIIQQLPILTESEIQELKQLITDFAIDVSNKFFMLLCREKNYYTVFDTRSIKLMTPNFCDEVIACAQDLGNIVSITRTEKGDAIEIWVDFENYDKEIETVVMYLFGYDAGVIECRK